MEPPSDDVPEKETNSKNEGSADKQDDSETAVDDTEFQKCLRKGRRDACPDIHCTCGVSEHNEQCIFHKDDEESDLSKENDGEKT